MVGAQESRCATPTAPAIPIPRASRSPPAARAGGIYVVGRAQQQQQRRRVATASCASTQRSRRDAHRDQRVEPHERSSRRRREPRARGRHVDSRRVPRSRSGFFDEGNGHATTRRSIRTTARALLRRPRGERRRSTRTRSTTRPTDSRAIATIATRIHRRDGSAVRSRAEQLLGGLRRRLRRHAAMLRDRRGDRISDAGRFVVSASFERPASMPNINNEGFAVAPQSECVNGRKPVFWSDDSETAGTPSGAARWSARRSDSISVAGLAVGRGGLVLRPRPAGRARKAQRPRSIESGADQERQLHRLTRPARRAYARREESEGKYAGRRLGHPARRPRLGDEAEARWNLRPEKLKLWEGRLLFEEEERILLLGLLLENVGADAAVRLGDPNVWRARWPRWTNDRLPPSQTHRAPLPRLLVDHAGLAWVIVGGVPTPRLCVRACAAAPETARVLPAVRTTAHAQARQRASPPRCSRSG